MKKSRSRSKPKKPLGYGLLVRGRLQGFSFTRAEAEEDLRAWNDSPFCTDKAVIVELVMELAEVKS